MGISPEALYRTVCDDVSQYNLGSHDPNCSTEITYKAFASSYLAHSVIRKWIPSDTRKADAAALEAFTSANTRCREWKIPTLDVCDDSVVFGEIRKIIDDFFHPNGVPLLDHLYNLNMVARPGPGAALGALGTSYYTKFFCSKVTSTSEYLYQMYKHYCERIPSLSDAERQRYESFGSPSIVSGSRCSFVPKTARTSRMICVEPLLNSYYQLGLATILEDRMREFFGINLSTQPLVNHRLARKGSIDGSLATIDLSSASDSISVGLCEWILPDWVFTTLLDLRSRTTEIDGKKHALYMISTMGNGFTFPLQTIIFSSVLKACTNVFCVGGDRTWSCFGDDIICPTRVYGRVCYYLEKLGFIINADKSFAKGPFRESCGADWFYGQPVRPVHIRKLDAPPDYLVAINQLNEWSAYTGITLSGTISLLLGGLPGKFKVPVPFSENMDSGVRVPLALCRPKRDKNGSFKYRTWNRRPSRLLILRGGVRPPGRLKELPLNPYGLLCSFLWGELVPTPQGVLANPFSKMDADYIMVRHNRKIYQLKPRCSPFWDYIPIDSLSNGYRLSWRQWETAVMFNLFDHCDQTGGL